MGRLFAVFIGWFIVASATACLWDRDTLDQEAKKMPGAVEAIVGYIDRNPTLYYQMRLDRIVALDREGKASLDDLDSAAVACERLGDSTAAIAWMEKKLKRLRGQESMEDRYRYHANLGTFYVHRWFRDGGNAEKPEDLRRGLTELQAAVRINPNAHYGREWVQIGLVALTMEDIARRMLGADDEEAIGWGKKLKSVSGKKTVEGLTGLILLGDAWESVDVMSMLQTQLKLKDRTLSDLAAMRVEELVAIGKKPRLAEVQKPYERGYIEDAFKVLRRDADRYRAERESYMLARLQKGRHPDTDPTFWNEFVPVPLTDVSTLVPFSVRLSAFISNPQNSTVFGAALLIAIAVLVYIVSNRKKRIRRSSPPAQLAR
ncbi:MAG: hypothetical protein K1X67_06715 [Fimbriimonadaceae bacterium]|nr:hypothetical protein [Fimbriimonadaceae bacterium]